MKRVPALTAPFLFFFLGTGLLVSFLPYAIAQEEPAPGRPQPVKDIYETRDPQVETVADNLEYLRNENKVIAKGNVVITFGDTKITADEAEVETDTKKAYAKGHVLVFKDDEPFARGDVIHYDFENQTGEFPEGTVISYPWKCEAEEIKKIDEDTVKAWDAVFTTCKGDKPPYEIHAKQVTFHQEDKILAKNVTIYSLGKPIFWWPYLIVPLQQRSLPFSISPGYNSEFGAYIETTKGFSINENLYGKLHADWRAKRGFGGGADLSYDYGQYAQGEVRSYWTQDERAPTPGALNPYGLLEERDRGRLSWWHRTDLDEYSNIQLRFHRFADEFFLQDFFKKEHRGEIEPHSFVTLTKNSETYGSYINVTKQINDYESLVERLPEAEFEWKNQPFFSENLYYENRTSFAYLNKEHGRLNLEEHAARYDHHSQWFLPLKYNNLNIMPFGGVRGTYYSRELQSDNDHFRVVADLGVDVRTQYFKTYETNFNAAGIDISRLRHVIEPFVRYEAVRSSVSDEKLTHFDHIDTIDDQDVVTFGLENRLQTRRVVAGHQRRVDIVSYNTFLKFAVNPHNAGHGTSFTTLNQELILRPYNWLQYRLRYEYDFLGSELKTFNQDLVTKIGTRVRFLVGHRYVQGVQVDEGNNQLVLDGRYALNKLWTAGGYLRWNADSGILEEWQLSATRDMDCLLFDFGYSVRNSDIDSANKELFFNLRLKHYPQLALRGGGSRSTFSEPRIGETVAGANQYGSASYYGS